MMQLTIERDALLKELVRVVGVVETKVTIPILANIHLDAGATHLMIRGTDLDIEIAAPCPAQINAQGATTVAGKVLADIVKKMPAGSQIGITHDAKRDRLKIVNGRSRFDLPMLPAEDFPTLDAPGQDDAREFILDARELRTLIGATRFAVSNDETRYYLNGICLHQLGEELATCATNGHQLALRKGIVLPAGADGMAKVILPKKLTGDLMRSLPQEGEVAVEVSPARMVLSMGEMRIVSKLIDGTFPDYERVIPKEPSHSLTVDRARLIQGVQRVATVAGDKARGVNVSIGKDGLRLACMSPERGKAFDDLDAITEVAVKKKAAMTIGVNNGYLLDILGTMDGDQVRIGYSDPAAPLRITDPADETEAHLMVLMPLRVADILEERAAA